MSESMLVFEIYIFIRTGGRLGISFVSFLLHLHARIRIPTIIITVIVTVTHTLSTIHFKCVYRIFNCLYCCRIIFSAPDFVVASIDKGNPSTADYISVQSALFDSSSSFAFTK